MSEAIFETLCVAFDQLGVAVLVLSAGGRVLFANRQAKAMLEKGRPVRLMDGCLHGKDRAASEELKRAIESISRSGEEVEDQELCLAQSTAGQEGAIGYLRLLPSVTAGEPVMALFITETGQTNQYGIDALAEAYGLSKAETRILKNLIEAQSPAEVATRLHISVSTVKSHIRKIFHKTNTSRQAELLRLVECCRTPLRKTKNSGDAS